MYKDLQSLLNEELDNIRESGMYKQEYVMHSPQGRAINVNGKELLNFCSNNYLGLSGRPELAKASDEALEKWGFGVASVRFICGTQQIHKDLEAATAKFLGLEDAVTYSSCFMANVGLFQTFFGPEDAIISDELNHASIIDAVRLTKSERHIFKHMDMADLEEKLKAVQDKRLKVIATDGVFSMDGDIAPLKEICDLADKYGALVMVDDAHGVGVLGDNGRGTQELTGTTDRIDFLTGTFGKALGGAGGAYTATRKEAAEYLRQRSRTYLFSNALDTGIAGAALFAFRYVDEHPELRERLWSNTEYFREQMKKAGFSISDAQHSITPIMLSEEKMASEMGSALFDAGIYAVGFSFPVVPKGKARIRVQVSAAHTQEDLEQAVATFTRIAKELKVI
ncbi:MAG TPA: glycine C-acetyltransferase [Candidatus Saccharimonadales bacterium]|nr:glycine C-acetyltransferase [Candidatus Saccharimonadales bacterium]